MTANIDDLRQRIGSEYSALPVWRADRSCFARLMLAVEQLGSGMMASALEEMDRSVAEPTEQQVLDVGQIQREAVLCVAQVARSYGLLESVGANSGAHYFDASEVEQLWRQSLAVVRVTDALASVGAGLFHLYKTGEASWLLRLSNPGLEAINAIIQAPHAHASLPADGEHRVDALMGISERLLPDHSDFGGLTLGQARRLWAVLLDRAFQAIDGQIILQVTNEDLEDLFGPVDVGMDAMRRFIDLVQCDVRAASPSVDPAVTPLIKVSEDGYLISPLLVGSANVDRNLTKAALVQSGGGLPNISEVGPSGLADLIRRHIPSASVAAEVPVKRFGVDNPGDAGDIDLAVWDEGESIGLIFELKSKVRADGYRESVIVDSTARGAQAQIARLRGELADGSAVWPSRLPEAPAIRRWHWFATSIDRIPQARLVLEHEVPTTSIDYIRLCLQDDNPAQTLGELQVRLSTTQIPSNWAYAVETSTYTIGQIEVAIESIAVAKLRLLSKNS